MQKAPGSAQDKQTHLQISPDHLALREPHFLWSCCSQGEVIPFSVPGACSEKEFKEHKEVISTEEQMVGGQTAHLPGHCHTGSPLQTQQAASLLQSQQSTHIATAHDSHNRPGHAICSLVHKNHVGLSSPLRKTKLLLSVAETHSDLLPSSCPLRQPVAKQTGALPPAPR